MDTSVFTTIMFADVTGSTTLYEQLGDEQASRIIDSVITMMSELTEKHLGTVVKTIGDEIMCRFDSADQAFTTARIIQDSLQKRPADVGGKIHVRIGLHTGQALIREDGDVFGDAVNVAARVAAIARGSQILTTKETVDSLIPLFQSSCRRFDRLSLKGKSKKTIICEVLQQDDDVTRMSTMINFMDTAPIVKRLHLKHRDQELSLNLKSPAIFMGRDAQCDFIINSNHASRLHARIESRRGKFVIIDQSTNGTFVKSSDGEKVYLRREESPLLGNGVISLGVNPDQENSCLIHFSV